VPLFLIASRFVKTLSKRTIAALFGFVLGMLLLSSLAFSLTQHFSFGTSVYWAITTVTTVGYGDVDPKNTVGRIIANVLMITTIPAVGAVFAIWTSTTIVKHIRRLFGMDSALPTLPYTVVYGSAPSVTQALEELAKSGDPVVLVASEEPAGLDEDAVMFIAGDPADEKVIRTSHPERANRALIASMNDSDTLVIAVTLHNLAPGLEIFALTHSKNVARALTELGVRHTLSVEELVGHTLAKSLETPQAGDLLLQMVDTDNYRLRQTPVPADMATRPLSAARAAQPGTLVLGISRGDKVDLGLSDDPVLEAGDSLIVLEPCVPAGAKAA
jgi:voltage-gated potassium channel